MSVSFRCTCPFTSALDVVGDKWMLVIVKQMLVDGKETFKDFTESEEAIATNILSAKLKLLEELGMITKSKRPDNKKSNLYLLTEKGLALTPILVELASWSDNHLRDIHQTIGNGEGMKFLRRDKIAFAHALEESYRRKYHLNSGAVPVVEHVSHDDAGVQIAPLPATLDIGPQSVPL